MKSNKESKKYCQFKDVDRAKIQALIESKLSAQEIASRIDIPRQTIYREIKENRSIEPPKQPWDLKPCCIHFHECFRGVQSKLRKCPIKCPKYELFVCPKLTKFPFVCNNCLKRGHCTNLKYYYISDKAHTFYKQKKTESQVGIRINKKEFDYIDNELDKRVKKGQSLSHILLTDKNIEVSESTLRKWIINGYMKIKTLDLRYASKYQKRKPNERRLVIKGKNPKTNHKHDDFKLFLLEHKGVIVIEVDTVIGKTIDNKCLLTIHIKKYKFQFGFVLNSKNSDEVNNVFYYLIKLLGRDLFSKVFMVILTDNGTEFSKLMDIEFDKETGELLTHVFYCNAYNSQQKGACENNHRLIRYIKEKGVSMNDLTQDKVNIMFSNINSMARTSLDGFTPYEVLEQDFPDLASKLGISKIDSKDVVLNKTILDD